MEWAMVLLHLLPELVSMGLLHMIAKCDKRWSTPIIAHYPKVPGWNGLWVFSIFSLKSSA